MDFKPDWTIHYVQDHDCDVCKKHGKHDMDYSYIANIHTHGLDKYGHPEICVVLDIGEQICHVLNSIGYRIACNHEKFEEGYNDTVLANGYKVKFVKYDRDDTLYLILPDANNHLPENISCTMPYCNQMKYAQRIHKGEY